MMESFCAEANFKAFLHQDSRCNVLKETASLIEREIESKAPGTLNTDLRTLFGYGGDLDQGWRCHGDIQWTKIKPIKTDVSSALRSLQSLLTSMIDNWTLPTHAFHHRRYAIRGIEYTTQTESMHDCAVFFQPLGSDAFVPGLIKEIISVPTHQGEDLYRDDLFLVIRRYREPYTSTGGDPFLDFADFGVQLWCIQFADELCVVPAAQRICHSIGRRWNSDAMALKPLDRVRFFIWLLISLMR